MAMKFNIVHETSEFMPIVNFGDCIACTTDVCNTLF